MKKQHILLGILITVGWAGNIIVSKVFSQYLPPFLASFTRFLLVSLLVLPFKSKITTDKKLVFLIAQIWGVLYFSFFYLSFILGIDASASSIIIQFTVPITALIEIIFLKQKIKTRVILGIAASMLGLYFMKDSPNLVSNIPAFVVTVCAAISWSFASFLLKSTGEKNSLGLIGWMSLMSLPGFLILATISEYIPMIPNEFDYMAEHLVFDYKFFTSLLYMVVISTLLVQSSWAYMLRNNPTSQVMTFMLLVPIFGIILSWIILDEQITFEIILGAATIIIGMSLILFGEQGSKLTKKLRQRKKKV